METLLRTILIWTAAFLVGRIVPKDAIIIPLISMLAVSGSLIDFFLMVKTGRGLLSHFKNSKK